MVLLQLDPGKQLENVSKLRVYRYDYREESR